MGKRRWTREDIVTAIQARWCAGKPLHTSAVVADDEALTGAARNHFGTWRAAVEVAGFDYAQITRPKLPRHPAGYWTRERVIMQVRGRGLAGKDLSAHRAQIDDSRLYSAAVSLLGSWETAVREAGYNYDAIRLTDEWTPARVVEEIRQLHAAGLDLSDNHAAEVRPDLYGACDTHFGGYRQAITAAGLDYQTVRRTREWSREKLIAYVQELATQGPVNTNTAALAMNNLYDHGFGSWQELLSAAGIPFLGNIQYFWTRDDILAALRARMAAGLPVNSQALKKTDMPLWAACNTHFGSPSNALEALGVPVDRSRNYGGPRPGSGRKRKTRTQDEGSGTTE